ncbi:hypothetical protein [Chitinophaga defluvii]|uniref:YD repeat-containing protein n=1 Tax=Chitinophaga defluvii TaxID=3163343 RepID=A0ABV2T4A6_9BACT
MNKLVLPAALCLLSFHLHAQGINDNISKQHLAVRGSLTLKDWSLRGPVKSVKACTYSYDKNGQQAATVYCTESDYSSAGVLLRRSNYSNLEKNTDDSWYFYSNNRIDSITGFQKKVFLYDNNDHITEIVTYGYYEENKHQVVQREKLRYDQHGMVIQNTQTTYPEKEVTQTTFKYDKKGEIAEQHTVSADNDILFTNEFDTKGQLYKSKTVYKGAADNTLFTTLELNKQGDISAMTSTDKGRALLRTYQYEYDTPGNWLKQTQLEAGKVQLAIVRTITYYPQNNLNNGQALTSAAADMPAVAVPLMPAEVVTAFITALGQQQYNKAYNYCTGGRWGTAAQFSHKNMYGGITATKMLHMEPPPKVFGQTPVNITATVFVADTTNGSGTFVQQFQLQKKDDGWKIAGIKLISSTRPADNWSLKLPEQPDFTPALALQLAQPVYDTVSLEVKIGNEKDSIERTLDTLRFFKDDKTTYCIAVMANRGPEFGASSGWCDVLLFSKQNNSWQLQDAVLNAGGGGRFGYPGHFVKLVRTGDAQMGVVLHGGLTHMGESHVWADIIGFGDGKLKPLIHIPVSYEYEDGSGETSNRCYENKYRFEKNGKQLYDLILEQYDCKSRIPVKKVTVPYSNGYTLPAMTSFP